MIAVLEDFNFEAPKTKQYQSMMKSLALNDQKTLLVLSEANKNIVLSGRNVQNTKIVTAAQVTTFDLMNADKLILVESSISKFDNLLK